MEVDEEWPQICPCCNISIPNQVSLISHKQGRKHILKAGEYERRLEEDKRTIFVSGAIMKTPEVAQLLLKNYFEENFGTVEKVNIQEKYCFIVFDDAESAEASLKETVHEFTGYKVKIKPKTNPKNKPNATGNGQNDPILQLRNEFNAMSSFQSQFDFILNSFITVEESYKNTLNDFINMVKRKCDFFELDFNLIGSATIDLLKPTSDIDLVVRVVQTSNSMMIAGLEELGRQSVRSKQGVADPRMERPVSRLLFILTGAIIELSKTKRNLTTVHAVPGARKPLIRFVLDNKKIELSVNNEAALVNTEYVRKLNESTIFRNLLKVTRFIFEKNEIIRIGRMSSYSVVCVLIHFLSNKGYLESIQRAVNDSSELRITSLETRKDELSVKQWDYRVPEPKFNWPQDYGQRPDAVLFTFIQLVEWLTKISLDNTVLDTRTGEITDSTKFYGRYELNNSIFKESPFMVADPFEVEHNTTGQISAKNLERMNKTWKRILLRSKMKRFTDHVNALNAHPTDIKDWGITLLLPEINTPKPSTNESFEEGQSKNSFNLESDEKLKNFFQYLTDVMRIEMNQTMVTNEMTSLSPPTSKKLKNVGSSNERVLEVPNGTIECKVQHVLWVGRRKIKQSVGLMSNDSVTYGCVMALLGSFFAGSSMVLQKVGVRKSRKFWWLGILCLILGEILTVVAYTNAPAVLVSPLGAMRVIVTTLLSVKYLREQIQDSTKIGIAISILGSILIVIHAPKRNTVNTFDNLRLHLESPEFISFVFVLGLAGVCNILGSIGVLLSKGIGIVIGSILNGNISYLFDHLTWIVIIGVVGGAILQLHFLNLSLKYFDASVIAPLKYVGTNILVVIGSCLLYKEFNELTFGESCGLLSGFGIVTIGTFYVHGIEAFPKVPLTESQKNLKL